MFNETFPNKKKSQIISRPSPPADGDKRNLRHGPPEKVRSRNRQNQDPLRSSLYSQVTPKKSVKPRAHVFLFLTDKPSKVRNSKLLIWIPKLHHLRTKEQRHFYNVKSVLFVSSFLRFFQSRQQVLLLTLYAYKYNAKFSGDHFFFPLIFRNSQLGFFRREICTLHVLIVEINYWNKWELASIDSSIWVLRVGCEPER